MIVHVKWNFAKFIFMVTIFCLKLCYLPFQLDEMMLYLIL